MYNFNISLIIIIYVPQILNINSALRKYKLIKLLVIVFINGLGLKPLEQYACIVVQ